MACASNVRNRDDPLSRRRNQDEHWSSGRTASNLAHLSHKHHLEALSDTHNEMICLDIRLEYACSPMELFSTWMIVSLGLISQISAMPYRPIDVCCTRSNRRKNPCPRTFFTSPRLLLDWAILLVVAPCPLGSSAHLRISSWPLVARLEICRTRVQVRSMSAATTTPSCMSSALALACAWNSARRRLVSSSTSSARTPTSARLGDAAALVRLCLLLRRASRLWSRQHLGRLGLGKGIARRSRITRCCRERVCGWGG